MRTRRITWPTIALAMVAVSVSWARPAPAQALTAAQVQKQIENVRRQLAGVGSALELAGDRLSAAERRVRQHRRALAQATTRRRALQSVIGERAAQLYMLGTELEFAVGQDLTELADKLTYLDQVNRGSRELLEEVRALEQRATTERKALAIARARAHAARNDLAARSRKLSAHLSELKRLHDFLVTIDPRRAPRASRGSVRGVWCPVAGPNYVYNNWGAPRPGGPHTGVDISASHGTGIRAVLPGTVVDTPSGGWIGIGIVLRDLAGNEWWYAHLGSRVVRVGQRVAGGEYMGTVGCTGRCYGPHLHFEYHPGGGGPANPYRVVASAC